MALLGTFPKYFCNDNGCHLHTFCVNRNGKTQRSNFLDEITYVIDRMHVKGHVKSCQEKYSPSLIKDLDAAQTIICELVIWFTNLNFL